MIADKLAHVAKESDVRKRQKERNEAKKLAEATEATSRTVEEASAQFEKTCAMAQLDLPPALESIERTSREFEELALHLRIMTGGKRKPAPPKPPRDPPGRALPNGPELAVPLHAYCCLDCVVPSAHSFPMHLGFLSLLVTLLRCRPGSCCRHIHACMAQWGLV